MARPSTVRYLRVSDWVPVLIRLLESLRSIKMYNPRTYWTVFPRVIVNEASGQITRDVSLALNELILEVPTLALPHDQFCWKHGAQAS